MSIVKAYPTRESRRRSREGGKSPLPCLGEGRFANRPNVTSPQTYPPTKRQLPAPTSPHLSNIRRSRPGPVIPEGWNPAATIAPRPTFPRQAPVIPAKAGIQRARQRSAHGAEGAEGLCPTVPRARPRHSSEGWNPACATAERTRGAGAEGLCPSVPAPGPVIPAKAGIQRAQQRSAHGAKGRKGRVRRSRESPVIPAKAGIQRARQRSAHGAEGRKGCVRGSPRQAPSFQRRLESSVRDSGAHTGRRGGRVVSEVPVSCSPLTSSGRGLG